MKNKSVHYKLRARLCLLLCGCTCFFVIPSGQAVQLPADDFDVVRDSYGQPEHIAGKGQLQDVNGWTASMEGTNALMVELSNAHMTMADAMRNLYIADKESHAVLKLTPDGTIHTVAGTHIAGNGSDAPQQGTNVALNNPNGLYVLPQGTVFILDLDNGKIRRLGTNGIITTIITNTLPLNVGRGLWVSPAEDTIYYAAGTEVRKWTSGGGVSVYASGFNSLGNLTVDPTDGNLVVTDRGAHRVYRVYSNGTRAVIAGDGTPLFHGDGGSATNAGLEEVRGIAFLPHGGFFLSTHKGGDIWYVDTNRIAHVFIAGNGTSTQLPFDTVCEPRGISIAPWGDLIITENDFSVIRILRRQLAFSDVTVAASSNATLTWYSMPAVNYEIQDATNLNPANWQTLGLQAGAPSNIVTTGTDTNAASGPRYYRIRTVP